MSARGHLSRVMPAATIRHSQAKNAPIEGGSFIRCVHLAGAALLALATSVPAPAVEVSNSAAIKGTLNKAWAALGDFCGIKDWHPAIANCVLSEKDGAKIRTLTTKDGGVFVEKMTQWDDAGHSYGYAILES